MIEMRREFESRKRKNTEEIKALKLENEMVKRKLEWGGGTPNVQEEHRNQRHFENQTMSRMEGENNSHPFSTTQTTSNNTLGLSSRKHPFTCVTPLSEEIMEVLLPHT